MHVSECTQGRIPLAARLHSLQKTCRLFFLCCFLITTTLMMLDLATCSIILYNSASQADDLIFSILNKLIIL